MSFNAAASIPLRAMPSGGGGKKKSSKSKSKSKKKDKGEGGGGYIDLLAEGRKALQLQQEAYPVQLEMMQRYGPDMARAEVAAANARSDAERAGIQAQGGQFRDAILSASPEIRAANDAMQKQLGEIGPSAIETELNRGALEELKMGGNLSADETRQVVQGTRAAASSRGLGTGFGAAVQEVLARTQYAESRKNDRRNYAKSVEALTQQRTNADRGYVSNTFSQAAGFFDPQMRLYGRGGSAVSGQTPGTSNYQPFLSGAVSTSQANLQAQVEREQMAQQQQQFDASLAWDQESFGQNRTDSLMNASANRRAGTTSAAYSAGGAALGLMALAFL